MTGHLNEHHIILLTALRDATALRREPKTLTPDGHEHWFSLRQLRDEGRLGGFPTGALDPPARTLYKRQLAARKTLHGTVLYAVTDQGITLLAELEERAGITETAALDREIEQARLDIELARARWARATARKNILPRRPSPARLAELSEEVYQR
jgi:hypothetical protein